MDRLEDAGPSVAEARGCRKPEAAAHAGRDVGEDVAERVLGQEHVESLGMLDELQPCRVDEHVLELNVRIVRGDARDVLAPEPRRLEHVHLVHRGELRPPRPGKLERAPGNPLDRLRCVGAGVVGRAVGEPAAGAVVEAADELADDQQVDAWAASRDGGSRRHRERDGGRSGPAPAARRRPRTGAVRPHRGRRRRRPCTPPASEREAACPRRGSRVRRSCAPRSRARSGARGGRRSRPQSPPVRFRLRAGRRCAASANYKGARVDGSCGCSCRRPELGAVSRRGEVMHRHSSVSFSV